MNKSISVNNQFNPLMIVRPDITKFMNIKTSLSFYFACKCCTDDDNYFAFISVQTGPRERQRRLAHAWVIEHRLCTRSVQWMATLFASRIDWTRSLKRIAGRRLMIMPEIVTEHFVADTWYMLSWRALNNDFIMRYYAQLDLSTLCLARSDLTEIIDELPDAEWDWNMVARTQRMDPQWIDNHHGISVIQIQANPHLTICERARRFFAAGGNWQWGLCCIYAAQNSCMQVILKALLYIIVGVLLAVLWPTIILFMAILLLLYVVVNVAHMLLNKCACGCIGNYGLLNCVIEWCSRGQYSSVDDENSNYVNGNIISSYIAADNIV